MNSPLNIPFIVSHKFGYVVWSFLLNFRKCLISFFISSFLHWWFRWALFNFHVFMHFLKLVLVLNSNFKSWWSNKRHGNMGSFHFSGICWCLLCYQVCGQLFRRFHELLRRRQILFCFDEMFYRCLVSLFKSQHLLVTLFLCLVSVW